MTGGDRTSNLRHALLSLLLGVFLAPLLTTPATADWLVMTDGARVETQGAWSERGKLLVFTDTLGNLVSVRRDSVDLEASHRVTAEALEAANRPAPPPPPPRESVFRITDADVDHIDPEDEGDAGGNDDSGDGNEPSAPPPVSVTAWDRQDNDAGDGTSVRATLENQGTDVAVGIIVTVTLYDDDGVVLTSTTGRVASTGLVPGQTTDLVADFPGIFDFAAVNFDIQQRTIATRTMEEGPSVEDSFGVDG